MTLLEWFHLLRSRWQLLVIIPIVFAIGAAIFSWGFLANEYSSSVDLYILTKAESEKNATVTTSDMTASQQLANDVAVLVRSNHVQSETAKALSMTTLEGYTINVSSSNTNRVITITVTGHNPDSIAIIADELANQSSKAAVDIMDLRAVNIIDSAVVADTPSGPSRSLYTLIAFAAGLIIAIAIIIIMDLLNTAIRTPEEAESLLEMPVLGRVPRVK